MVLVLIKKKKKIGPPSGDRGRLPPLDPPFQSFKVSSRNGVFGFSA